MQSRVFYVCGPIGIFLWYVCNFIWVFVLLRYNNKTYRIDDVAFDQNPKCTFTFHTGEQMSYLDYYRYKYIDFKRKRIPFMYCWVFKASSLVLVPLFAVFSKSVKWNILIVIERVNLRRVILKVVLSLKEVYSLQPYAVYAYQNQFW